MTIDDFTNVDDEPPEAGTEVWDCDVCHAIVINRQGHVDWHNLTNTT